MSEVRKRMNVRRDAEESCKTGYVLDKCCITHHHVRFDKSFSSPRWKLTTWTHRFTINTHRFNWNNLRWKQSRASYLQWFTFPANVLDTRRSAGSVIKARLWATTASDASPTKTYVSITRLISLPAKCRVRPTVRHVFRATSFFVPSSQPDLGNSQQHRHPRPRMPNTQK